MGASMDKTRQQPGGPLATGRTTLDRWIVASLLVHLAVLGVLLYTRPPQLMPVEMPGDHTGHLVSLTYEPGNSAPPSTLQAKARPPAKPLPSHAVAAPNPTPAAPSAPSASTSTAAATGADALGDGDTTLALVVSHPPPHPDLAQLPAGTRGDVIVDVVIDKTGRIAKFTMTHGLGHGVDETVLAAIQQWTFQPATRNGIPVASEQELLFHYERG
jgi:periplasmic protein TonB